MKIAMSLMLAGAFLLSGCGAEKKDSKTSDAPGQNPLNAPTDYLGAVAKGKKKSEATVVNLQVAPAVQQFQAAEGRFPKSLQEMVDEGYLTALPAAPRGMKTDYNPETGEFQVITAK
jgi:hypothetical protein